MVGPFDSITIMKRRRFMQALAAAPAVPALIAQQAPAPPAPGAAPGASGAGRGGRGGRGGGGFGGGEGPALIEVIQPDAAGDTVARFFTTAQFNALKKLGDTFMPAVNGAPGALECGAPEFLDFLIGVSPADRKQLYRGGLDALNAHATAKFAKPFADLDAKQIDAVIRPLLVATPWALDAPKDPVMHFIASFRTDISEATRNSRAWAESGGAGRGGRGGRGGGIGGGGQLMWLPIDPIYKS